jgi:hypothetical protein
VLAALREAEELLLESLAQASSADPLQDAMATAAKRARLRLVRELRLEWFGDEIIESGE